MAKRLLIILVLCWQGLLVPSQPAYAAADPGTWSQTCYLTGENTFGYPLANQDDDRQERSVSPGDRDLQDMPENDEDDAFRYHAEAKSSGLYWFCASSSFPDYPHAPCSALSRDIHKPPPEGLS
jgi:hypothetical protein